MVGVAHDGALRQGVCLQQGQLLRWVSGAVFSEEDLEAVVVISVRVIVVAVKTFVAGSLLARILLVVQRMVLVLFPAMRFQTVRL